MRSEIGNKTLLRKVADFLGILGQQQMAPDLNTSGVMPVVDIGGAAFNNVAVPIPNASMVDATYLKGQFQWTGLAGLVRAEKYFANTFGAETADTLFNLDTTGIGHLDFGAVPFKCHAWWALINFSNVTTIVGKRLWVRVRMTLANDDPSLDVYHDYGTIVITTGVNNYTFTQGGFTQLDTQTVDVFKANTWNGIVPITHTNGGRLSFDFQFLDGTAFPAATNLTLQALISMKPTGVPLLWNEK